MSHTVLLVEDDSIVRDFVINSLERENLIVLPACDGAEALEIIGGQFKVDLLLTDVNLGDSISGIEVAKHIMEEKPGTQVLVMSGFPEKELLAIDEKLPFLRKPFTHAILTYAVRQALLKFPPQSTSRHLGAPAYFSPRRR